MLDGGRYQTRAEDGGRGVRGPAWKESKVACCQTYPYLRTVPLGALPRYLRMPLVDEMEHLASANLPTGPTNAVFPLFFAGNLRRRRPVALPILSLI
jgi:hypothetical protein